MDTGAVDNSVLGSTSATISGTQARVRVKQGVSGVQYKITFVITLSNTDILEEDVLMHVIDD